ncbi:MAG: hypothetical protein L0Y67_06440 [Gammaproteobacteria bacterium]|nr:hypothetical protein [Gammaproteobacteria bacterium]
MAHQNTVEQYGSSTWLCDYIVEHQLRLLQPKEVVDFGAGGGKNGLLVRRALGNESKLIAVEGYEKSARMLAERGGYDRVDTGLLQDWVRSDAGRYSLAIFGDVLEHMTPRQIHDVMEKCFDKFDHVIVVVPLHDIFQDEAYGNPLEVHRAYITNGFFDRYKPIEKHIIASTEFTIMNLLIATRQVKHPLYRRFFRLVFHTLMLVLQPLGLARPFVEVLKRTMGGYKWLIR